MAARSSLLLVGRHSRRFIKFVFDQPFLAEADLTDAGESLGT